MPKLPQIKAKQLIAALHRAGFEDLRHQGTSHKHLYHPDGRHVMVAVHPGTIPKGTLHGILKDAEISVNELRSLL